MILPVVWLHEAVDEYYEALRWYADVSPSLSQRFAQSVEVSVEIIAKFPFRYPIVFKDRRRAEEFGVFPMACSTSLRTAAS